MKTLTLIIILITAAATSIYAKKANEDKEIRKVVFAYEQSLNKADVNMVTQQFTEDGILVLQGSPTIKGTKAVKEFYEFIFTKIDFDIKFIVEEVVQMSPEWAFVRTITRTNDPNDLKEGGHEIFILKKQPDGNWKISRYAGSAAK